MASKTILTLEIIRPEIKVTDPKILVFSPQFEAPPEHENSAFNKTAFVLLPNGQGVTGVDICHPHPELKENIWPLMEAFNARAAAMLPGVGLAVTRDKFDTIPVLNGGPLEGLGFVLIGEGNTLSYLPVADAPEAISNHLILEYLNVNNLRKAFAAAGHAGWGAKQLDSEVQAGYWKLIDYDPQLVFDMKPEDRYAEAAHRAGFDLS